MTNGEGVAGIRGVGGEDWRTSWIDASSTRRPDNSLLIGGYPLTDHDSLTCVHDRYFYQYNAPDPLRMIPFPCPFVAYDFIRLASTASAASFSAFIAKSTSGRPSREGDQHLEMKFQTSSESHSLEPDGRPGRSPMTTLYIIMPSLALGKGCSPVTTCVLTLIAIAELQHDAHLVRDNSERIDITLLRRVAVLQFKARGIEEFRCHVSNGARGRRRRTTRVDSVRI